MIARLEEAAIGQLGHPPETALWMTPRGIMAGLRGHARNQRMRVAMHPMSNFDSEREAQRFIEGNMREQGLPHEEQEKKLEALEKQLDHSDNSEPES